MVLASRRCSLSCGELGLIIAKMGLRGIKGSSSYNALADSIDPVEDVDVFMAHLMVTACVEQPCTLFEYDRRLRAGPASGLLLGR